MRETFIEVRPETAALAQRLLTELRVDIQTDLVCMSEALGKEQDKDAAFILKLYKMLCRLTAEEEGA